MPEWRELHRLHGETNRLRDCAALIVVAAWKARCPARSRASWISQSLPFRPARDKDNGFGAAYATATINRLIG
jgi:hypothetical protein